MADNTLNPEIATMHHSSPLRRLLRMLLTLSLLGALATTATASDLAKEQRWADQIVDELIDGDALWLEAGGSRWLAIRTEPDDTPKGAVIVLHGVGAHPNWPQVVYPLRVELAARGWTTLSLQLPILENDAENGAYLPLFDEVAPRLDAALAHLSANGDTPVVIVAHSMGSAMASYALRDRAGTAVAGFVGIGMGGADSGPMSVRDSLRRMAMPVLDLYGDEDLKNVLERAPERREAGRSPRYTQRMVAGANHFFDGQEDALVDIVAAWLEPFAVR